MCRSIASAGHKSRISPDISENKEMEIQGDFAISHNSINCLFRHILLFIVMQIIKTYFFFKMFFLTENVHQDLTIMVPNPKECIRICIAPTESNMIERSSSH